jgi:hypothetical protein
MDQIHKIEEITNYKPDKEHWRTYDGYKITTRLQEILVLVSNEQSCCESWGYLTTSDDLDYYLGADLLGVQIVDLNYDTRLAKIKGSRSLYEGDMVFVRFQTSRGPFEMAVYNGHNGYYGHHGQIISRDLSAGWSL